MNKITFQYRVNLKYSQYRGFFVCKTFNYCLIEDRYNLLTNFYSLENAQRIEFPAWIRFKSFDKVAKFYVSTLAQEEYNNSEIYEIQDVSRKFFLILFSTKLRLLEMDFW